MQAVLSPQLHEATHSLIENLLASEAFIHYQQAQSILNEDNNASDLLKQLSQAQASLRQKQAKGEVAQADTEELHELQAKVQRNRVVLGYAQSQQEAVNFLREIDAEISGLLGISFASFANHATC
ncbi:MAG: YlbF family regulator [Anaerolineales bacterium]